MPNLGQTVVFNVSEETGSALQELGCNNQLNYRQPLLQFLATNVLI